MNYVRRSQYFNQAHRLSFSSIPVIADYYCCDWGHKSAPAIPHASLAELLPANGILGPHPAARALGLALLGQLGLGHPVIAGHGLAPGALSGSTDLRAPVCLAVGGFIGGEHAEAPEGEASSEWGFVDIRRHAGKGVAICRGGGELDAADLEVAKVGCGLAAVADKDELDLGEDEAVAAAVLAHGVVQVGQAAEVLDALDVALDAHARVEAVEGLDEADHAGGGLAAEDGGGRGGLAGHVGDEHAVGGHAGRVACYGGGGVLGGDGQLEGPLGAEHQGVVDLGEVVRGVDGVQGRFGFGVALGGWWGGEEGGGDGDGEAG